MREAGYVALVLFGAVGVRNVIRVYRLCDEPYRDQEKP